MQVVCTAQAAAVTADGRCPAWRILTRRPWGSAVPLAGSLAIHAIFIAAAALNVATGPRRAPEPEAPVILTVRMADPAPLFVPPKEIDLASLVEPPEAPPEVVDTIPVTDEILAVEIPEPEPIPAEELARAMPEPPEAAEAAPEPPAQPDAKPACEEALVREAVPLASANAPPRYPRTARSMGWEGTVVLEIRVGPDGSADEVTVVESSGHRMLDDAAVRAVREWRFLPAERAGESIASRVAVAVVFRLT